ncbi:large ribosomal subunit protein bL12m isoform X2 [Microcaecilia unicolor]|uniref:Large ribosomal subunit protein bL12m n=1 Tax=Microcaecilia unicolor TaxID=1415580 RepID=A0A6P7YAN1_9AMPH|nr:39S ribosomal protein L12, mitochondrial isoform X2 [Microcaecilia unicolor]
MQSVSPLGRVCLRLWNPYRQRLLGLCPVRMVRMSCERKNEVLASAPLDSAPKQYPPKIQQLVNEIAGLTLLEIVELNDLLKKTLKIENMGMMPMGAVMPGSSAHPAAQAVEEEDIPEKKEKSLFIVKLTELNAADKVKLIKEVKNCMQGLNLVQAKKLVESLPQEIVTNVSKAEAEKVKAALEAAGGKVVLE